MRGTASSCLLLLVCVACSSSASSGPSDAAASDVTLQPSPTGYPCGPVASAIDCFAATYCLQSTVGGQIVSGSCQDLTPACPPGGDADLPDCACVEDNAGLTGCRCSTQSGQLVLTCPVQDAGHVGVDAGVDATLDATEETGPESGADSAGEAAVLEAGAETGVDATAD
jgi:hypothetical protein